MNLSNNKILITGGASGIGLGLTERFIQENNQVIICGRRQEALKEVSDKFPAVITKVCDLSVEAERVELYEWIAENHPDLNVLVNNAGIQNWMDVSDNGFYEKAKNEISINVLAPLHLITSFCPAYIIKHDHECNFGVGIYSAYKGACLLRYKIFFSLVYHFIKAFNKVKKYRSHRNYSTGTQYRPGRKRFAQRASAGQ